MHAVEAGAAAGLIEQFIRRRFEVPDTDLRFNRQVHLWEDGYVDSMGVVELVEFLEQSFEIVLPETVLFSPDFTHIDGMARVVAALQRERQGTIS